MAVGATAEVISQRIFPYFVTSGTVTKALKLRFVEILCQAARLCDSWLVCAVAAALAVLQMWGFRSVGEALHDHKLSWAVSSETGHCGWGLQCRYQQRCQSGRSWPGSTPCTQSFSGVTPEAFFRSQVRPVQ
jgi:hypothetical protein